MVLFIAGILGAIAAPRVWASNGRARAHAAAKRIAADLEYARSQAMMTSTSVTVNFNAAKGAYGIAGWRSPVDARQSQYLVYLSTSPYNASIAAAALGDSMSTRWAGVFDADPVQKVVFDGYGKPDASGWIVISSGGILVRVSLDTSGRTSTEEISRSVHDSGVSSTPASTIAIGDIR
jgi:Tfp pilus assembly protein FimT